MRANKLEGYKMASDKNYFIQDHENRITRLEVVIENIQSSLTDIKQGLNSLDQDMKSGFKDINNRMWMNFFWMLTGFVGVLGLIAHAVHWI